MYKKIYIAILAIGLAGCKKAPLNVAPTDQYSIVSYPQTVDDLNSVLAAGYSNLRDQGYLGFHYLPKALSNSMHTVNSLYDGDGSWNEMANTNLAITNQYALEAWQTLYTGVKNCNAAIAAVDVFNAKYSKPDNTADVNAILGQAYFLRGYYYMQLETLYGESYLAGTAGGDKMGVPIYDAIPSTLGGTQKARATVKEVWDFIEADLKKSADLLKGRVWTGNDVGRVTEWAAKGQLGKAYVYTQNWAEAKTVLLDVIEHSGKTLMPFAKYKDAFNGNVANKFNEESLFELNVDPDAKGGYGIYGAASANAAAINGLIWSPWALGGSGKVEDAFPLGYGNEFMHDQNITRFGYSLGTAYNLVANPKYTGSNPSYKNPQQIMDPVYKTKALLVRANKTADPRLFVNGLQPWLDSVKFDGVNYAPSAKPNNFAFDTGVYGWSIRKYSPTLYNEGTGVGNAPTSSVADAWNYYLLRMADVYLLYAEAAKGSGDNGTALEYLNKVKRRAYDLPINTPSAAVDYKSLNDKTAAIDDPVLGNNPLYYERWAELFNEGSWWFDVCRWRIGKSEAAYYKTAINLHGTPFQWNDNKSYAWPIPLNEITSNGLIKQNPGYSN